MTHSLTSLLERLVTLKSVHNIYRPPGPEHIKVNTSDTHFYTLPSVCPFLVTNFELMVSKDYKYEVWWNCSAPMHCNAFWSRKGEAKQKRGRVGADRKQSEDHKQRNRIPRPRENQHWLFQPIKRNSFPHHHRSGNRKVKMPKREHCWPVDTHTTMRSIEENRYLEKYFVSSIICGHQARLLPLIWPTSRRGALITCCH